MEKYASCIKTGGERVISFRANQKVLAIALETGAVKLYSLSELVESHKLPLLNTLHTSADPSIPPPFALSSEMVALVEEVPEGPSVFDNLGKNLEESTIASYPLTKEAARGILRVSEASYNTVSNILSVTKATSHLQGSPGVAAARRAEDGAIERFVNILVVKSITDGREHARGRVPFFTQISSVHFSPSGELLVVGNEKAQYFFILRLFPDTSAVHPRGDKQFSILYSLFRGYTQAGLSDITFSRD